MTALTQTEVLKSKVNPVVNAQNPCLITFIKAWKNKLIKTWAANLQLAKSQTVEGSKYAKWEQNIMDPISHYLLSICCHYAISQIEWIKAKDEHIRLNKITRREWRS